METDRLAELMATREVTQFKEIFEELVTAVTPPTSTLKRGESAVVAIRSPKVASLFFDRVWTIWKLPESIQLYCGVNIERDMHACFTILSALNALGHSAGNVGADEGLELVRRALAERIVRLIPESEVSLPSDSWDAAVRSVERTISMNLFREAGVVLPELFSSESAYEQRYKPGQESVLVASLSNLGIVDEEQLEWDQVLEFRQDHEARRNFRRLLHWIDKDFIGKTQAFIEDEISKRLDEYNWTVRKHGLKTAIGTIRNILDEKSLLMSAGAAIAAGMASGGMAALMAGAGIMVGKCCLSVAENLLEVKDYQKKNPEIAFVHEIKSAYGKR